METVNEKLKVKTIVLIAGIVLMLINVCLPDSVFANQGAGRIITFAFGLAFNILTVLWCF